MHRSALENTDASVIFPLPERFAERYATMLGQYADDYVANAAGASFETKDNARELADSVTAVAERLV